MRLEDMREQFPKMPESMKRMIEQEVAVQIGQEKENDNPKVVTYKKRKKKNMAHLRQRELRYSIIRSPMKARKSPR